MEKDTPTLAEYCKRLQYEWDKIVGINRASSDFWRLAEAPKISVNLMGSWMYDGIEIIVEWPVAKRRLMTYLWPATWRDAFKERWFPWWARQVWPVRYRSIGLDELIAVRKESDIAEVRWPLRYVVEDRELVEPKNP